MHRKQQTTWTRINVVASKIQSSQSLALHIGRVKIMLSNLHFKLYSTVSLTRNSKKCPIFSMIIFEKKSWFYPCTTLCLGQETMFIFLLQKWELLTTESSHPQCCSVDVKHCCRNNSLRQKRKAPVFFFCHVNGLSW